MSTATMPSRLGRKRSSLSPTELPLKKRHLPAAPEPSTTALLSPVDFSLPNRTRAKVSPGKCSHTDTESPTSEHSVEGPRPLDLSTHPSPVKPPISVVSEAPPTLWNPTLLQSGALFPGTLLSPLLTPFLPGLGPDLLKLLLAAATPSATEPTPSTLPTPSTEETKEEPQEPSTSEESKIINPATGNKVRRNYKNMTRERRMEANARERTRVHTIGAAFDALQRLIPSLAPDQKLSKLSILRIGCKYILLLAAMSGKDYSSEQCGYTVPECLEMLNETIVAESKLRRVERR